MSKFVKPVETLVSDSEYIKSLVDVVLKKDLCEDECVCSVCHGTGLIIRDNIYGLENDPNKRAGMFPYKHQSISFCDNCYKGVAHKCKWCGKVLPKFRTKCDCEKQQLEDDLIRAEKEAEKYKNAKEITEYEAIGSDHYYCFYSEHFGCNEGYFSNWDEFFENWYCNHEGDEFEEEIRPEYVWNTEEAFMKIWATEIVDNATENLYEDAYKNISDEKLDELQKYLDKWCDDCGVGATYYPGKYKVRIPWEKYDRS